MLNLFFSFWLALAPGTAWFTAVNANAGTAANNTAIGTVAWGSVTFAQGAQNSTYAQANSATPSSISNYLRLSNYGFSIPAGATIDGVKVSVRATMVADSLYLINPCTTPLANYYQVSLVNESSVVGSVNKAADNTLQNNLPNSDLFGGTADTWSGEASAINWNSSNAGCVVAFQWSASGSSNCSALVDRVNIEITYTPAAASGMPRRTVISQAGSITYLRKGA